MNKLIIILSLLCLYLPSSAQTFQLPEIAGTLRLGFINGKESVWADQCKIRTKNDDAYTLKTIQNSILGKGSVKYKSRFLADTKGVIIELEAINIPDSVNLVWAYGGCSDKEIENYSSDYIDTTFCFDNIFSIEGQIFSVYYGTSRRLRIVTAVVPESDIHLGNGHKQASPLSLINSDKKTNAHVLSAIRPLNNGEKLYFCIYKPNPKADYNYYMLPDLFKTGSHIVHNDKNWMKSTPD